MSEMTGLDLRYPIGALFVVTGILLAGFGLLTAGNADMYQRSGGVNINLWWGLVMLVVGILFLTGARRGSRVRTAVDGQRQE